MWDTEKYNIKFRQGATFALTVTISGQTLTGYTAAAQLRDINDKLIADFEADIDGQNVTISLAPSVTGPISYKGSYIWDLALSKDGVTEKPLAGEATVLQGATK